MFIPLCIWGLISSLLLHLILLRSVFIEGGEWRLSVATLAFAAAIILVQRLSRFEGRALAQTYSFILGAVMTLFAIHHAFVYRVPVHPLIVLVVDLILFAVLGWVGYKITEACSVDSEAGVASVAESGLLPHLRVRRKRPIEEPPSALPDEAWRERLPQRHPGRVILYFSLFAIPAFGIGVYFFGEEHLVSRLYLGALLFVYLWCALSLLFLSSFSQLCTYFEKRGLTVPDAVGIPWLAVGCVVVTAVMVVAFILPQPASIPGTYVRDRMLATYRGWDADYGPRESGGGGEREVRNPPEDLARMDVQRTEDYFTERYRDVDQMNDPLLSEVRRSGTGGTEAAYRKSMELRAQMNESVREAFNALLKVLFGLAIFAGLVVLYVVVASFVKALSESFGSLRPVRKKSRGFPRRRKRKKKQPAAQPVRFAGFRDPFLGDYSPGDGDALVRYLWEAMLAYCADAGAPCPFELTPFEFVEGRPAPLEGFEDQAAAIAELFSFSEFSGRSTPDSAIPRLKEFWADLQRHAALAAPLAATPH